MMNGPLDMTDDRIPAPSGNRRPVARMLTHAGHRRLLALLDRRSPFDADGRILGTIADAGVDAVDEDARVAGLEARGWLTEAPQGMTVREAKTRYRQNPLENVRRINFEITTQCNFQCLHCRNGDIKAVRERDIGRLKEAAAVFLSLGIRRYDFIGGEVSRYGNGWLDLVSHLREVDAGEAWADPLVATLYTNGWWLGQKDFLAAGKRYADEAAYLDDLAAHGLTHILFSIDGPAARHDRWRQKEGLFERIRAGILRVKAAGIEPRLSLIVVPGDSREYLRPLAEAIYGAEGDCLERFADDTLNHFSNFIDSGRAADGLRIGRRELAEVTPESIRCKAFFRPSPTLRIMADGSLGICPLMLGDEGYGNIHDAPLVELLNRLDETPLYRLHAGGRIGDYLERLDPQAFATGFDHLCAVRIEVNRVALADQKAAARLRRNTPGRSAKPWDEAAALLREADGLIVAAGAGLGVDSGLPDFRGNEGFWQAYPALANAGVDFARIAEPVSFTREPRLAWGFYGHRLNLYRQTRPHDGFRILQEIAASMAHGCFVFTSNVDGQFEKAGYSAERIVERHGSIHRLQCQAGCRGDIWSAAGFAPEIDEENCQLLSPFPVCPHCSGIARPNILMFHDSYWISRPAGRQLQSFDAWAGKLGSPVVVELGAGFHVPTVRRFSDTQKGALIRINPVSPAISPGRQGVALQAGALEALRKIAAAFFG